MTFDSTISLGAIVEVAATVIGVVGTWFTFKERLSQLIKQAGEQKVQHEDNQKRFVSIELKMSEDFVKKSDFRDFDHRFEEKVARIEHTVNNAAFKAAGMIKDMLEAADRRRARRRRESAKGPDAR